MIRAATRQGYDQGYRPERLGSRADFGFGFDPFGFGFGFGGYQQQSGASYSGSDTPEMQAARNFVPMAATRRPAGCWTA